MTIFPIVVLFKGLWVLSQKYTVVLVTKRIIWALALLYIADRWFETLQYKKGALSLFFSSSWTVCNHGNPQAKKEKVGRPPNLPFSLFSLPPFTFLHIPLVVMAKEEGDYVYKGEEQGLEIMGETTGRNYVLQYAMICWLYCFLDILVSRYNIQYVKVS